MGFPTVLSRHASVQYLKIVASHLKEMPSNKISKIFESVARQSSAGMISTARSSEAQSNLQQEYRPGEVRLSISGSNRHTSNYFSVRLKARPDHILTNYC
jgi:hypothetical protein